jgi:hypothetical protein
MRHETECRACGIGMKHRRTTSQPCLARYITAVCHSSIFNTANRLQITDHFFVRGLLALQVVTLALVTWPHRMPLAWGMTLAQGGQEVSCGPLCAAAASDDNESSLRHGAESCMPCLPTWGPHDTVLCSAALAAQGVPLQGAAAGILACTFFLCMYRHCIQCQWQRLGAAANPSLLKWHCIAAAAATAAAAAVAAGDEDASRASGSEAGGAQSDFQRGRRLRKLARMLNSKPAQKVCAVCGTL